MIPSINSLMGVGLVFSAGHDDRPDFGRADPVTAIKYQIVVTIMLVGATALGSVFAVSMARYRIFNSNMQLDMPYEQTGS